MTQFTYNALESENSSLLPGMRIKELDAQRWKRNKSEALASKEGLCLNDAQWQVIVYLRELYLEKGLSKYARTTARDLNKHFRVQGGSKYLYNLFPGGQVVQGSRLANLRTPANATDQSFGSSY